MRVFAGAGVSDYVKTRGGAVYVVPRRSGCCVRTITLEAVTTRPDCPVELVDGADGFRLYVVAGFREPDELQLEIGRRGKLHAYWNGQAWVG